MNGTIKAHCMGMEFPKRDTDGPGIKWVGATIRPGNRIISSAEFREMLQHVFGLPSAADLDAVAEEQRVKEKTSAQILDR